MENQIILKENAIYLAGLLDGEGYFSMIRSQRSWLISVTIRMTDKYLMEEVATMIPWSGKFGGGSVTLIKSRSPKWKTSWQVKWNGDSARRICEAIEPYSRLKKPQINLILSFLKNRSLAREEARGIKRAYPSWFHDLALSSKDSITSLNKKGPPTMSKNISAL